MYNNRHEEIMKNRQGVELFNKQENKETEKIFAEEALKGNTRAMVNLGLCYFHWKDTETGWRKAVECYKKAAEVGDSFAKFHLGVCNLFGLGCEENTKEANKWLFESCDQNNGEAVLFMCMMFKIQGKTEQFCRYLVRSIRMGNWDAWDILNIVYQKGDIFDKDYYDYKEKYNPIFLNYLDWIKDYIIYFYWDFSFFWDSFWDLLRK